MIEGFLVAHYVEPMEDDDREWEMYEERFSEWTDEIKINIIPLCQDHFNQRAG